MGCIDSDKFNPVYLVGHIEKSWVEIIRIKWGQCEIWIHIWIERIVVVEFHFTKTTNKKKANKQTKRKKKSKPSLY